MKNIGEVIDKMEKITLVQEKLESIRDMLLVSNSESYEVVEDSIDLLNEYIAMLRSVKVNM